MPTIPTHDMTTLMIYMCPLCGENHYQIMLFHIRNVVALFFELLCTSGIILEDGETHTKEQCF
jgi:hypothetical protein